MELTIDRPFFGDCMHINTLHFFQLTAALVICASAFVLIVVVVKNEGDNIVDKFSSLPVSVFNCLDIRVI